LNEVIEMPGNTRIGIDGDKYFITKEDLEKKLNELLKEIEMPKQVNTKKPPGFLKYFTLSSFTPPPPESPNYGFTGRD